VFQTAGERECEGEVKSSDGGRQADKASAVLGEMLQGLLKIESDEGSGASTALAMLRAADAGLYGSSAASPAWPLLAPNENGA